MGLSRFIARYRSTCQECGGDVNPGDRAVYVDDEVVHEDCPPMTPEEPVKACPICWLTICDCG